MLISGSMTPHMQRVRIGLTGLAFVFVVVLLAAVFTRGPAEEEPITPNLIEQQRAPDAAQKQAEKAAKAQPKEPLAELGVAPGGSETENSLAEDEEIEPGQ